VSGRVARPSTAALTPPLDPPWLPSVGGVPAHLTCLVQEHPQAAPRAGTVAGTGEGDRGLAVDARLFCEHAFGHDGDGTTTPTWDAAVEEDPPSRPTPLTGWEAVLIAAGFWTDAWRFTTIVNVAVAIGTIGAAGAATLAVFAARTQARASTDQATASSEQAAASREQAQASQRQAEASERELIALVRPILVDVPIFNAAQDRFDIRDEGRLRLGVSASGADIQIPIRNIGTGPAMIASEDVVFSVGGTEATGEPGQGAIAVGESGYLRLRLPQEDPAYPGFQSGISQRHPLKVEVEYSDVGVTRYGVILEVEWWQSPTVPIQLWRVMRVGRWP
jgi:hypothetical protein